MASTRNRKENETQIGPYTLDGLLVEQAYSAIYLAHHAQNNQRLFLVTLQPEAVKTGDLADRFQRRAKTVAQLKHPMLLPLQDFGVDGKRPYAVMPYRAGQFLAEKLAETTAIPTEKSEIIANLELVKKLATGLAITHPAGLIHHDLRPENIYLDEEGQPYLLDLVVPPAPLLATNQMDAGQPTELDYQSPEQLAGKALSGRSNIFSLGVLLYRLLAGHKPARPISEWNIFEQKGIPREIPLAEVRLDLTSETYKLVRDSIWQQEWSRFETVEAFIWVLDLAALAESAPPPPSLAAWRQRQILKYGILVAALLLVGLLVLLFWPNPAEQETIISATEAATTLPATTALDAVAATASPTLPVAAPFTATAVPPTESVATAVPPTATMPPTATQVATSPPLPTATASQQPSPTSCVPSPPPGWVRYSIQADDSLSALGQATNTTVEQIMQVNCLDSILLSIGQQIWLRTTP